MMRGVRILTGLLAAWALTAQAWAQDDEEYDDPSYENVGFFNFVNTLSAEHSLMIEVDGSKVGQNGLGRGQESGPLGLDAGSYGISMQCEGYRGIDRKVTVKAKKTKVYFIYEIIEEKDGEVIKKIGVKSLEPVKARGKFPLSIYSLVPGDRPTLLQLGTNKAVGVQFGKAVSIPGWNGKQLDVKHKKRKIMELEAEDVAGYHHVIVPYLNAKREVEATVTVLRNYNGK